MSVREIQIAVIGGGPAGLQAGLTLGRMHREAIVFDSSEYRNAPVEHMHNMAGFDGAAPADFRRQVRAQVEDYETVSFASAAVVEIAQVGGSSSDSTPRSSAPTELPRFELTLDNGDSVLANAVVLATGLRDEVPDVPGLAEVWGTLAAQCPLCHAHEYAGQPIAMLGGMVAPHIGPMVKPIASELVVIQDSTPLADADREALDALGARITEGELKRVERLSNGNGLRLTIGGASGEESAEESAEESIEVGGIFIMPMMSQRAPFAQQLGLELNGSGCVRVDPFGHTSLPGVYAAGDMAHLPELPMPMASVAQSVAQGQTAAATAIKERG